MSLFKDHIWQQILDGQRSWSVSSPTPEACDLFEVEVVLPLRELCDERHIEIEESEAPAPGRYRVQHVMIRGIVNFDANA